MIVFKNILSFGLTFEAFKWLVTMGTKATPLFIIVGSIQVAVCLSSIPLCKWLMLSETELRVLTFSTTTDIYGKRMRAYFHRNDFLALCKVR